MIMDNQSSLIIVSHSVNFTNIIFRPVINDSVTVSCDNEVIIGESRLSQTAETGQISCIYPLLNFI